MYSPPNASVCKSNMNSVLLPPYCQPSTAVPS